MTEVERYHGRAGEGVRCRRCGCEAELAPDGLFHCSAPQKWCTAYPQAGREDVVSSALRWQDWQVREADLERAAIQGED